MLLGERLREPGEREVVRRVLEQQLKVKLDMEEVRGAGSAGGGEAGSAGGRGAGRTGGREEAVRRCAGEARRGEGGEANE